MLITCDAEHKPGNNRLDNSMIPAINVVFLLLVFFMLAGHIEAYNALLKIPVSASEGALQQQAIEIKIQADGARLLDGQAITGTWLAALSALPVNAGSSLNLYIHKALPVTQLDPVLVAARELGVARLHIVTGRLP